MKMKTRFLGLICLTLFAFISCENSTTIYTPVEPTYCTVIFDSNGGTEIASQKVEKGKTVPKPTNPIKEGYTFSNWYNGNSIFDFSTPINSDITLKALWSKNSTEEGSSDNGESGEENNTDPGEISENKKVYTIIFNINDGSDNPITKTQNIEEGKASSLTTAVSLAFARAGYVFSEWNTAQNGSGTKYSDGAEITLNSNLTLFAQWTAGNGTHYTVKHYQQNITDDNYTLIENDTQILTGKTGSSTNANSKTYEGFTAQTFEQKDIAADGNTTIEIYYNRNIITITFSANGGTWSDGTTADKTLKGKYGAVVNIPDLPTLTDYKGNWDQEIQTTFSENKNYSVVWMDSAYVFAENLDEIDFNDAIYKTKSLIKIGGEWTSSDLINLGKKLRSSSYTRTYTLDMSEALGITKIPDRAFFSSEFAGKCKLFKVILPATVTEIGTEAFSNTKISSINLPESVKVIGDLAFEGTSFGKIEIPEGVKKIGTGAFRDSPLQEISLPSTLNVIGEQAFKNSWLKSIEIPDSCTVIESFAFENCEYLQSVNIPANITRIGTYAFSNCKQLASEITIGSKITEIPQDLFYGCRNLTKISLPNTINVIGQRAFSGCISLETINIPTSLETIERSAFCGTKITEVIIPSSVKSISSEAFSGCKLLKTITLDKSTSLETSAFSDVPVQDIYYNGTLEEWIENGAKHFGNAGAFQERRGYKLHINQNQEFLMINSYNAVNTINELPANDTLYSIVATGNIDENLVKEVVAAISKNSGVKKVKLNLANTNGLTNLLEKTFYGQSKITEIVLPESLINIGNYAFSLSSLTNIVIPDSVQTIGEHAFESSGLENITLPSSLTEISAYCFCECKALTKISIPNSVVAIGENSFNLCSALSTITIPEQVKIIGKDAFLHNEFTSITFKNTENWYRSLSSDYDSFSWSDGAKVSATYLTRPASYNLNGYFCEPVSYGRYNSYYLFHKTN